MELKQILQLIDAVSGSSLDKFEYEENGSKLSLGKKERAGHYDSGGRNEEMSQALKPSAEYRRRERVNRTDCEITTGRNLLCSTGRRCRSVCENRG